MHSPAAPGAQGGPPSTPSSKHRRSFPPPLHDRAAAVEPSSASGGRVKTLRDLAAARACSSSASQPWKVSPEKCSPSLRRLPRHSRQRHYLIFGAGSTPHRVSRRRARTWFQRRRRAPIVAGALRQIFLKSLLCLLPRYSFSPLPSPMNP